MRAPGEEESEEEEEEEDKNVSFKLFLTWLMLTFYIVNFRLH